MGYDNSTREARARLTRASVLDAARTSFLETGYAATTIKGVAQAAGVSPETVYKTFRNKATLLKSVYDVSMAGDDEPIPMAERPEFQAVYAQTEPAGAAAAYGELAGWLASRTGPLVKIVLSSHSGDPELEEFARTIDRERLIGAGLTVGLWAEKGWLRPGLSSERAQDMVWALNSPAVHLMLMERGWTLAGYQEWLAGTLLATVLRSD